MRIAFIILLAIHGVIHLFGFLKSFGLSEFEAISQPVSKTSGVLWLLTFLLFATTIALYLFHSDYWWIAGILAIVLSQSLIFNYWSDAKFGTIANVLLLFVTIVGYATFRFQSSIKAERSALFEKSLFKNEELVTEATLLNLPPIIQKWLNQSGIIDQPVISNVYLTQELQLKMKPEQSSWEHGVAEQYFTVYPPAFNWDIRTQIGSVLGVVGRDKFEEGKGEMIIKLLSLVPVADAKNDDKVNQATLQRYLAEIVWFPSAALSPYITWEDIDQHSARATMEFKGTIGSGEFHFDDDGNFEKFVALRYQDSNALKPTKWTVIATRIEERNGIKIPTACEASWELENGTWTWLKLTITDIQYNLQKLPVAK